MAVLTVLQEKLAEAHGLAIAAARVTRTVERYLEDWVLRDVLDELRHDAPEAYDLLRDVVAGPAGYVAMMASRDRSANVLAMLRDEGADDAALDRVHLPAGLNLGGKRPGEIALSVVAEIAAWSNGRSGRPMREGTSP